LNEIKQQVKAFFHVLFSGFLGILGFSNLAPNSSVGQALGQSIFQQSVTNSPVNKNAPSPSSIMQPITALGREPGIFLGSRGGKYWKPTTQKRKKHTNTLKCKAKARRKRKLARK